MLAATTPALFGRALGCEAGICGYGGRRSQRDVFTPPLTVGEASRPLRHPLLSRLRRRNLRREFADLQTETFWRRRERASSPAASSSKAILLAQIVCIKCVATLGRCPTGGYFHPERRSARRSVSLDCSSCRELPCTQIQPQALAVGSKVIRGRVPCRRCPGDGGLPWVLSCHRWNCSRQYVPRCIEDRPRSRPK